MGSFANLFEIGLTPTKVTADFNEAETYEQISSIERNDGLQLIGLLAPTRGSKVLDLGCGTGFHSKVLADLVGPEGKVVAIDPDTDRLRVAKSMYSASNLEFLQGSGEDIPGGGYDLVFSNHVLHWCKNRSAAFAQVANSLNSGGRFAFSCVSQASYIDKPFILLSSEIQQALADQVSYLDEDEPKKFACLYNFKEVYRSTHDCVHTFKNAYEFIEFFLAHFKQGKFDEADFDIDAILNQQADGGLFFKYPIFSCILLKE